MTKKTKLIPFNYELYQKGAKAVFENRKNKILFIGQRYHVDHGVWPFFVIYEGNNSFCEFCSITETGSVDVIHNTIMLETELEEKEFWVNVYKNGDVDAYAYKDIADNCLSDCHIGQLKITYTEEDLIK